MPAGRENRSGPAVTNFDVMDKLEFDEASYISLLSKLIGEVRLPSNMRMMQSVSCS
jgi:hypothetical protein